MDPITKMGCAHTIGQGCLDIISNKKKGPAHFWMTFGVVICEKKNMLQNLIVFVKPGQMSRFERGIAPTYLQPHYGNGVFGNVYLLA